MSRRDGAIVAWHEVPGTAPPQKSRPLGYGVIGGGVRTDSMIGVTKFPNAFGSGILIFENAFGRNYAWQQGYGAFSVGIRRFRKRSIEQQLEHHRTRTFQEEYLALRNTAPISTRNTSGIGCARSYRPIIPYPTGRFIRGTLSQALRARLRSGLSLRDVLADISQQHLTKPGSIPPPLSNSIEESGIAVHRPFTKVLMRGAQFRRRRHKASLKLGRSLSPYE